MIYRLRVWRHQYLICQHIGELDNLPFNHYLEGVRKRLYTRIEIRLFNESDEEEWQVMKSRQK